MKYSVAAAALFAASVSAQDCVQDAYNNFYCGNVTAITYTDVGGAGSYNKVTNMVVGSSDPCSSTPQGYTGSLAPLNEPVSWHFRGPMLLKQFAVYTPGGASSENTKRKRHGHNHARFHKRHVEERGVGDWVTATMDGKVVSWINSYTGPGAAAATPPPAAAPLLGGVESALGGIASAIGGSSPVESSVPVGSTSGGWGRQAYYNSETKTKQGLTFFNYAGSDSCSGTFDTTFGLSLSFASSDGLTCSSTPQTLDDVQLPSSAEIIVMSDQPCVGDECGFFRPGTSDVAYQGFGGSQKAFFFQFQMPDTGETTANQFDPVNMPAIWMLNSQIPRTLQYGNPTCSCWTTGCGEFDMFEVLAPGYDKAKSTLHGNKAGGSSDYFPRPFDAPIKVGMVLDNNNMHVKILDDSMDFESAMSQATINEIISSTSQADEFVSLFSLANALGDKI